MEWTVLRRNLTSPATWLRAFLMLLLVPITWVLIVGVVGVAVAQSLIVLVRGNPDTVMNQLGKRLSDYFGDIMAFLLFSSEVKPFPFTGLADFPVTVPPLEPEPLKEPEKGCVDDSKPRSSSGWV